MSAMLITMDLSRPWALIRSPIDMEALLVLRGTTRPLTGREVARLVRAGSQPAVNAALRRLADEGLVRAEEAGNAYLYTFNREHLGAPAVELLASIRAKTSGGCAPRSPSGRSLPHMSHLGSAARGDGDTRSDIDIFVVRPAGVAGDDASGASSSSGSPTTSATGPATTLHFRRSGRPTCGGFVASTRPSSTSCAATRSPSPARGPLSLGATK